MTNAALEINTSPIFAWVWERMDKAVRGGYARVPVLILQGGTSSGKTYSTIQALFAFCVLNPTVNKKPTVVTVVGQDVPNLKKGALLDAERIAEAFERHIARYHRTDKEYLFTNGAKIQFTSYETAQDAKAGKRDILFVNEAQGIGHEIFSQLKMRTSVVSIIDYNPDTPFWAHEFYRAQALADGTFCRTTYLDNPYLPEQVRASIEERAARDENFRRVYAEGRTGGTENLIYQRVEPWVDFPDGGRRLGYGLDFGYTDPLALVECCEHGETIYCQELIYESGLTMAALMAKMKELNVSRRLPIWADAARPEMITELRRNGFNVAAAKKGPSSVLYGIQTLAQYPIRAIGYNLNREFRQYKWKLHSATGKTIQEPSSSDDHALDAVRYWAVMNLSARPRHNSIVSI